MKIGLDIDGVIADFNNGYVERIREVTGRDLFATPPLMETWNYPEEAGYTTEELRAVWREIHADPTFWLRLNPYDDIDAIVKGLRWLYACGHDVYFITARPGTSTKQQTEQWLYARTGVLPTVLLSADKAGCCESLELDDYIDDRWENAEAVAETTKTRSYLLTRPWNARYDAEQAGITRVASLDEFFSGLV